MPTNPATLDENVLWQGRKLLLRAIRPEDEAQHRAFVEHLTPEDLRLRFFDSRREIPGKEITQMVQIDYAHEMAFIAVETRADGSAQTLGVARAVTDSANTVAEFAIIVNSDLHGRGLGELLLRKLIRYLQQRGTQRIVCDVLHENGPMQRLLVRLGFHMQATEVGDSTRHYARDLGIPV
jgi:acetyltransferase